ncbi:OpgC domain-containing protein [Sphingomonas sp. Tas61C01]|uniref:OpgC domain-containing protein n=1 Tax=Sphingomonas sp. Tas61C01 TaxID=3458297 RepID=UPI00403E9D17
MRIDILRGMAIIFIVTNHVTARLYKPEMNSFSFPTPSRYGYSSAAEIFVMLSGYMVGFIYFKRDDVVSRLRTRSLQLYSYNLLTFVACLPFLLYIAQFQPDRFNLAYLNEDPFKAMASFVALAYAPSLLDIMRLYIAIMLISTVLIAIGRRSELVAFGISALAYSLTTALYLIDIDRVLPTSFYWFANPFCWQFVFFIMICLGKRRFHLKFFARLEGINLVGHAVIWLLVAVSAYSAKHSWLENIPASDVMASKEALGPVRLIHALLMLIFYGSVVTLAKSFLTIEPFRTTATMGKYSLQCFLLSVWLTYGVVTVANVTDGDYAQYVASTIGMLAIIALFARWKDRRPVGGSPLAHEAKQERRDRHDFTLDHADDRPR